ncbi:hypothetical protein [Effusibacillus pohliae]|uniref:hypothetical protein n=1 Tax=Effusibacillus pohliae TaxID=232270 RepID=UPI00037042F3|nr:hypothetical protein [Effusibacillus pohliae]
MKKDGQAVAHTLYKGEMSGMVTRVFQVGNSKITVHSPCGVIAMEPDEQREWFKREWESGNPAVRRLVEIAREIDAKGEEPA